MAIPGKHNIQKIDDIAVQDAVGEVSQHAGDQQGGTQARGRVGEGAPARKDGNQNQRRRGKQHEKQVVVLEHSEGRTRVVDLNEIEKARDHRHKLICRNETQNEPFRDLVKQVEGQGDKQQKPHPKTASASSQRAQRVGCAALEPTSGR